MHMHVINFVADTQTLREKWISVVMMTISYITKIKSSNDIITVTTEFSLKNGV